MLRFIAVALLIGVSACVRTAPEPRSGYWVASDSSQYSPVARFLTRVDVAPDCVLVVIDSGSLRIPGEGGLNAPPLTRGSRTA